METDLQEPQKSWLWNWVFHNFVNWKLFFKKVYKLKNYFIWKIDLDDNTERELRTNVDALDSPYILRLSPLNTLRLLPKLL